MLRSGVLIVLQLKRLRVERKTLAARSDRQLQTAMDVGRWWIEETCAALRANAQRLIY